MRKFDIPYQTLRMFSLTENYNKWIYDTLLPYLGDYVLEVGGGIGNLTQYLEVGRKLTGIEINSKYISYLKLDFPELKVHKYNIADSDILSKWNSFFDSIVCVNVLEHIEDDIKALSNMYELLKPGGNLLLFVPAHTFLYGRFDKNLGHFRRYEKKSLVNDVENIGFRIVNAFYINKFGLLGWVINSRGRRKEMVSPIQLFLFDKMIPIIKRVENTLKGVPMGLSLFVVAKKKQNG